MKNFSDLTYAEIEEIDDEAAIEAIADRIVRELRSGYETNLLDGDHADEIFAVVGNALPVRIGFRPGVSQDEVWAVMRDIVEDRARAEEDEMTDEEADATRWEIVQEIVADRLEKGLAKRIWQELTNKKAFHGRREAA
jgi:hypothetical protein